MLICRALKHVCLLLAVALGLQLAVPQTVPGTIGLSFSSFVGASQALAQERKRQSLFKLLFKRRDKKRRNAKKNNRTGQAKQTTRSKNRKKVVKKNNRTSKRQVAGAASNRNRAAASAVTVNKNENAGKILVVGDFMAGSAASGLERLYREEPMVVVVNRSVANSGIVRDDVQDWTTEIGTLIDEVKPVAVVFLAGMNDRQLMRLPEKGRVEKLSDEWIAAYRARAQKIGNLAATKRVPLVWMGLPPVRSNSMNRDYLIFNQVYNNASANTGAAFVDVWDGFTNAEGKFVSAGPDINGQIVRLRRAKGINMTNAGKLKLAFFADKALKKLGVLGGGDGSLLANQLDPALIGEQGEKGETYDPILTGRTVVISLGSPSADGGDALEGDVDFLKAGFKPGGANSFALVAKGAPVITQKGRVDAGWGKALGDMYGPQLPEVRKANGLKPEPYGPVIPKDDGRSASARQLPKVTSVQPVAN